MLPLLWKRVMLFFVFALVTFASGFDKGKVLAIAKRDAIDFDILPFASVALESIEALYAPVSVPSGVKNATRIDVHSHVVPVWYRDLVPVTGGSPTPNWTVEAHFNLMASQGIKRSIVSISTPGTTVYAGDGARSAALARLLNEYLSALAHVYPDHFSFYATTPLPYVAASINEVDYALDHLKASAIGLFSNFEGFYLGNSRLAPFFAHINDRASFRENEMLFVHPNSPCLRTEDGALISANPTLYIDGMVEFYFETARTFMDLSLSGTLMNFTKLNWIVPHAGGSFPSVISRALTSVGEVVRNANFQVFKTRLWWDTAGPTFPNQVQGLLGYNIPISQLLYGTDFPYIPVPNNLAYTASTKAIENATFLTVKEREQVFGDNAKKLFSTRL